MFRNVDQILLRLTNNNQRPVESSQLTGSVFYLVKAYEKFKSTLWLMLEDNIKWNNGMQLPYFSDQPENQKAQLNKQTYILV